MRISVAVGFVLLSGVAGLVLGFLVFSGDAEVAVPAAASDGRAERVAGAEGPEILRAVPGPATSETTDGSCSAGEVERLKRRVAELEDLLRIQQKLAEGCQAEAAGAPVAFPPNIPGQYREESFRKILDRVVAESQAAVDLVDFDCSEFPCIAVLRSRGASKKQLIETGAWTGSFGNTASGSIWKTDCGDGRQEQVLLLSPFWDWENDPKDFPPGEYLKNYQRKLDKRKEAGLPYLTEEQKNRARRLSTRFDSWLSGWKCLP